MKYPNERFLKVSDLKQLKDFYDLAKLVANGHGILWKLERILILYKGISLNKNWGKGSIKIVLMTGGESMENEIQLLINFNDLKKMQGGRIKLARAILDHKRVHLSFKNSWIYSRKDKENFISLIEQIHPEALALFNQCIGQGIDVGCGFRKTHPEAIGVDWIKKGRRGKVGNVRNKISEADVQTKGDNLKMFDDNSLNYVVARHNLEHYKDPHKTLNEWTRVLKKEGKLGVVVPNSNNPATFEETHYFNFSSKEVLRELLEKNGKLNILFIGECIERWSFYAICSKK